MEEKSMIRKIVAMSVFTVLGVLLLVSCSEKSDKTGIDLSPSQVMIPISQVEVKGATDGIPAPDVDPATLSKGYRYKPPGEYDPDNPDKWQVSSYFFVPSFVTVVQGDNVTLRIFVVNGDRHVDWIEAPDGSEVTEKEVANRGREYTINFVAEQAGYYIIHCDEHEPTMRITLLALPRKG